ncbi:hypothetical protein Prudu_017653, partial [Prunus dulcis]
RNNPKRACKVTDVLSQSSRRRSQLLTGPDPNSALEFEPDPVRVRPLAEVSVTQSQLEPQTGRIQGTVISLIRIPGYHGPGVPETREANVKCTDKTDGKLDVRGHRHIRRQHIPKAKCFCNWVPTVA